MGKVGNNIKKFLRWSVMSKAGWALISFAWLCIWLGVDSVVSGDWAYWVALPGAAYLASLVLTFVAFAWVINPIREYRKNKNNKKK
jgi:hypothetical protein